MTTGQWIVVGMFAGGLMCSAALFWTLIRIVRRDKRRDS